jgi:predicted nucleic acid-binding protein
VIHVVADASVAIKWFLPPTAEEQDQDRAITLLEKVRSSEIVLLEPPHWLAEVAAGLSRLAPATARLDIEDLYAMRIAVTGTLKIYTAAMALATTHQQHVFDTLYHAVALNAPDCTLVTADERYYRKVRAEGAIVLLRDFNPAAGKQAS